ncbi:hypothetical protein BCV72DRAFT_251458 [Rhizopus microsporus var. microsporus]|uniref:Tc1-like transposase DDE domain-containing protein n=1 Tax=Rhizopus microsporus var. microsporus TaxID=86635 RepID=A0A1X0QWH5_RHIZD|nr:hypothetical protein BCV72DRAFT_251458 [Rhizopus microsporus var. microsporus]
MFLRKLQVQTSAKQLDIHVRTAQRWSDNMFIKRKKTGRSSILHEEHKQVILEYIDENPSAALEQSQDLKVFKSTVYNFVRTEYRSSEEKIQERFDWVRKWNCTDMGRRTNCVFLDESAFHINLKHMLKNRA